MAGGRRAQHPGMPGLFAFYRSRKGAATGRIFRSFAQAEINRSPLRSTASREIRARRLPVPLHRKFRFPEKTAQKIWGRRHDQAQPYRKQTGLGRGGRRLAGDRHGGQPNGHRIEDRRHASERAARRSRWPNNRSPQAHIDLRKIQLRRPTTSGWRELPPKSKRPSPTCSGTRRAARRSRRRSSNRPRRRPPRNGSRRPRP